VNFAALHGLSPSALRALASSLRDGALSVALSRHALEQIAGARVDEVRTLLQALFAQGMSTGHVANLVSAVVETREHIPDPALVFEMVVSGPGVINVPTQDTAAVVQSLFGEARTEVLVVGFVVYKGAEIFAPLHHRMIAVRDLRVRMCLNIGRPDDGSEVAGHIAAFAKEFKEKHWPWAEVPELYYFPKSFASGASERGSLHAKCVIVDRRVAFVTSANFTEAAQNRNIEVGVVTRFTPMVERLAAYFDGLIESGTLERATLG